MECAQLAAALDDTPVPSAAGTSRRFAISESGSKLLILPRKSVCWAAPRAQSGGMRRTLPQCGTSRQRARARTWRSLWSAPYSGAFDERPVGRLPHWLADWPSNSKRGASRCPAARFPGKDDELAPALGPSAAHESGSDLCALHTLRAV